MLSARLLRFKGFISLPQVIRTEINPAINGLNDQEFFEEVLSDFNKWLVAILKPLKESVGEL